MKILFLGGGNMASAMISGLLAKGEPATDLHVVDVNPGAVDAVRKLGCNGHLQLQDAPVDTLDAVVLATKPQTLKEAISPLLRRLKDQLVLSICAGVRVDTISRWLGGHKNVVRAMPNTPALIGMGITGLYAHAHVPAPACDLAEKIAGATGLFSWFTQEQMLDAVTALSGSGPAYVFYFLESFMQAAIELGFTPAQAREFAYATFAGAVELAKRSDESATTLRERVTSKGGTTAAALASMSADQVSAAIVRAIKAADARARELGAIMDQDRQ